MTSDRAAAARSLVTLVPIIAGIVASSALLIDYVKPAPVFCDYTSGCEEVKHTAFAHVFGIPTPVFGVLAFAQFAVLSLLRGRWARMWMTIGAGIGAALAAFLLWVQHELGAFCKYCVVVDLSIWLVLAMAVIRLWRGWDPPRWPRFRWATASLVTAAALVPVGLSACIKPRVPQGIADEQMKTPEGMATVIDFIDFECPFCRATHLELEPLLAARTGKLRVVRKHVPLTRIHPHAMDAARAACCGEKLGKSDEMAHALVRAEDISPEGCEKVAQDLGLDVEAFRACVKDPATDLRIEADTALFRASQGKGLPTLWIGGERLEGGQPKDALENALDRAISRARS